MNGGPHEFIRRGEFDPLKAQVDHVHGRVMAHDGTLGSIRRELANIRTELHELNNWKEDSKVQEIAVLKGKIKKSDRIKDRVLYTLLLGGALEVFRLVIERWSHIFH